MEDNILIIFSKDPIVGQVKTRIGEIIGMEDAREVYLQMLQYTRQVIASFEKKSALFTPSGRKSYAWGEYMAVYKQAGSDLGERMSNAIEKMFDKGHKRVCLIGSDNFEINPQIIRTSFDMLEETDIVIGPSKDGGYYLIGMNMMMPELFREIPWSTDQVLNSTLDILNRTGKSVFMLPELRDCDELEDLPESLLKEEYLANQT